jgi:hypothetical protein
MNFNVLDIFKKIIDLLKPVISVTVNININSNNTNLTSVSISEIEDTSVINNKKTGVSVEQDERIKFGSTNNLWLHIQINPLCVNIGKYYSCTVNGKEIIFWLGAETMNNEAYVKLDIPVSQLVELELMKESKTICSELQKDGAFRPRITEFPSSSKQEELNIALNKKLKTFLEDIFNDR